MASGGSVKASAASAASSNTFHNMEAVIHELRSQLSKRGGADGIRALGLCFALNDRDKSGTLNSDEFEAVLQRCSVFLKKPEISALFRHFDRNGNGKIEYKEFLRGVAGKLNQRRAALIKKAFEKIDADGNGALQLKDIAKLYNTSKHPEVITGKKTAQQVYNEFIRGFTEDKSSSALQLGANAAKLKAQAALFQPSGGGGAPQQAALPDIDVSEEEFTSYYTDLSASIPGDDDLFALIMCNCWGIAEGAGAGAVSGTELNKFIATVKEKIRQKCKGRNEKEHLRLAFKFFDLDNSGTVAYSEFLYALEKFGMVLDEKSSRSIFASLDTSKNGRLSYDEFAAALYDDTAQYTGEEENDYAPDSKQPPSSSFGAQSQALKPAATASGAGAGGSPAPAPVPARKPPTPIKAQAPAPAATTLKASSLDAKHKAPAAPSAAAAPALSLKGAKPTVVFVVGGPGCGKGTVCGRLSAEFGARGLATFSAGDLLRDEQKNAQSELGALIAECMKEGKMVPGEVVVRLLINAIAGAAQAGKTHFLVDGFPRNNENVQHWNKLVGNAIDVAFVLYLDCPEEVMSKRLLARAATSGRADDNAATIAKRFAVFNAETVPVVKQYATTGRVRVVNAVESADQVYARARAHIRDLFNNAAAPAKK